MAKDFNHLKELQAIATAVKVTQPIILVTKMGTEVATCQLTWRCQGTKDVLNKNFENFARPPNEKIQVAKTNKRLLQKDENGEEVITSRFYVKFLLPQFGVLHEESGSPKAVGCDGH